MVVFTRGGYATHDTLTGSWQSFTFPEAARKIRVWVIGDTTNNPIGLVRLNDEPESKAIALNLAHNFELDEHVVDKVWYKLDSGSNGQISILGLKTRETH
jgi:hypothetical protein